MVRDAAQLCKGLCSGQGLLGELQANQSLISLGQK